MKGICWFYCLNSYILSLFLSPFSVSRPLLKKMTLTGKHGDNRVHMRLLPAHLLPTSCATTGRRSSETFHQTKLKRCHTGHPRFMTPAFPSQASGQAPMLCETTRKLWFCLGSSFFFPPSSFFFFFFSAQRCERRARAHNCFLIFNRPAHVFHSINLARGAEEQWRTPQLRNSTLVWVVSPRWLKSVPWASLPLRKGQSSSQASAEWARLTASAVTSSVFSEKWRFLVLFARTVCKGLKHHNSSF